MCSRGMKYLYQEVHAFINETCLGMSLSLNVSTNTGYFHSKPLNVVFGLIGFFFKWHILCSVCSLAQTFSKLSINYPNALNS